MTGEASAPKLTINPTAETPSEAVVKAASRFTTITDDLGRALKVRKLGSMQRLDLAQLVGAEGSANPGVMAPCSCAFAVVEIDGEPILPPNSYNELRALVGRLEDEGIQAVEDAYIAAGWVTSGTVDEKAAIKNS